MVSVSIENAKCYDSNDCCSGYTCVRARKIKDKFSKKLHPNCRRRDVNGNKKYSGCCKKKGSYSHFSFKKYKLPKKKMSKESFENIQSENTGNIKFLYPSEEERNALRERKALLCNEPNSRSPTTTRSLSRISHSPTTTRSLSRISHSPTPVRSFSNISPKTTPTRSPTRRRTTRRGRIITRMGNALSRFKSKSSPSSSPSRNQTRSGRSETLNPSLVSGRLEPPKPLSAEEQSKAKPSNFQTKKRSKKAALNEIYNRQRAAINEIYSGLKNNDVEDMFGDDVSHTGELEIPFSKEFEKCGNISGENTPCNNPKYSVCAKARRTFQKSLERKHSENSQFANCLPPQEPGKNKTHRKSGCCISKKEYGLGIQYKRITK